MKRLLILCAALMLVGITLQLAGLRIFGRPKVVDNLALNNPARLQQITDSGIVITDAGAFPLRDVFIIHPISEFETQQPSHGLGGLIEIGSGARPDLFVQVSKNYGFCGNYRGDWFPDFTLPPLNRFERENLSEYLITKFHALPNPELVGSPAPKAKHLIASFLKVAEHYQSAYQGPNSEKANELAEKLVNATEGRDHYKVLWFYGSLQPEKLLALAKRKIDEDIKIGGRGDAFHYLPFIEKHAPDEYLNHVFAVQKNLGHNYEQDHIHYTNILLKAGDWRGFDHVMRAMGGFQKSDFGNAFCNSGGPAWAVAQAALAEHPERFEDMAQVNPYISEWYFANRHRVSFNGQYLEVARTASKPARP